MTKRPSSVEALRELAASAPTLDEATEREYLRRIQEEDDPEALEALCLAHLRMVMATAKRYAVRGISAEDLIAEGNLGLTEAARRFDRSKPVRFSTYAAWWIRGLIRRHTLANRRVVGTPATRNARKLLAHMRHAERELTAELGQPPSRAQIADRLGVTPGDVEMVQRSLSARDVSIGPQDDGRVMELPARTKTPEELAARNEERSLARRSVTAALGVLDTREREIVRRRLLARETQTLSDVGRALGLSGERVRQIEKASKRKLRTALESVA